MTSKVLGIDLRDAGRDGVYRIVPDDPPTLVADAARAGLRLLRVDLAGCRDKADLLRRLARAFELPAHFGGNWDALADSLRDLAWLPAPGYVLLLDRANDLRDGSRETYATLRRLLDATTREWHARGVPFFVFMEFPDGETLDAAIDA
ncbi:barstar family protein [Fulvimonas soli]|jgi:hypothetical protein|uniref:Barstar (Barnase inhibitor) n=1 Tax=Fulvimonas soli TaxID=155197 RepID=A0A316HXA9_9GAMM|nr:barstar family protein [Fulvimonas soli]PWK85295.1 barstar (barnase inhibitor) [Fulvimonas soli]TNY26281.1 hypothetical protein BV497_09485 [Fulvimonas soli]